MEKDVIDYFSYLPPPLRERLLHALASQESRPLPDTKSVWDMMPKSEIIALYGVGDGGYFTLAERFLKWGVQNAFIIIEDDFEILASFLKTEVAKKILLHPQVLLVAYDKNSMNIADIIYGSPQAALYGTTLSCRAIASYRDKPSFQALAHEMHEAMDDFSVKRQYFAFNRLTWENVCYNVLYSTNAYDLAGLKNAFSGVPAILCGAGSSLEEDISRLKKLYDKALIIAGGTTIQILDQLGVPHHINVGVDPNFPTYAKIMQQTSFETPFIYSDRIAREGLPFVQGPLLFTGMGMEIESYFNYAFGHLSYPRYDLSVGIASFAIAHFLGCTPLVFVGQDFSLSKNRSYAFSVEDHPLLKQDSRYESEPFTQYIVNKGGDKEYRTTKQFTREIGWLYQFRQRNPFLKVVNCSSTGHPLPFIPQIALEELMRTQFREQRDLQGLLHAKVMQQPKRAKEDLLEEIYDSWVDSCDRLEEILSREHPEPALYFEIVYRYCLFCVDEILSVHLMKRELYWKRATLPTIDRIAYLREWVKNLQEMAKEAKKVRPTFCEESKQIRSPHVSVGRPPKGAIERAEHYPNGTIQSIDFLLEGELEGMARYFSPEGILLSCTNFHRGKRQGESRRFYAKGSLYASENYEEGQLQGLQRYYFEDGRTKSLLPYEKGRLEGTVLLYYPNGQLKREMHFKEGVREGVERAWNEKGVLLLEQHYESGKAVGIGKLWDSQGHVILEKEF